MSELDMDSCFLDACYKARVPTLISRADAQSMLWEESYGHEGEREVSKDVCH